MRPHRRRVYVLPPGTSLQVVISVEVHRELTDSTRAAVYDLVETVQRSTGHRPLSDQHWLDLEHGGHDSSSVVAFADGIVIGYCQVSFGNASWGLELVRDPNLQLGQAADVARQLIDTALGVIAEAGGGNVNWWVYEPSDDITAICDASGLQPGRTLLQMRVALPLDTTTPLETRPFVVGVDEQSWLDVNNAAFAAHPEQGGWDLDTLEQRELEPWFDPHGFLLHERDGRLAAFCWTKMHPDGDIAADHDSPSLLGEIYVIAVHPDFHGLGLGRALTVAGLASIATRGARSGMLYVDANNTAAMTLYTHLGFTVHATQRAYVGAVPASAPRAADAVLRGEHT